MADANNAWLSDLQGMTGEERNTLLSETATALAAGDETAVALLDSCEIIAALLDHILSFGSDDMPRTRMLLLGHALKLAHQETDRQAKELVVAYTYAEFCRIAHNRRKGQAWLTGTERLVQDAYLKMARSWDSFWDMTKASDDVTELVRQYFARSKVLICHALSDHYRELRGRSAKHSKLTITRPTGELTDVPDPRSSESAPVSPEDLHEAISQLPEDQKAVVELRVYNDLTFAEIAFHLAIKYHQAVYRWSLAVESLRQRLGNVALDNPVFPQ